MNEPFFFPVQGAGFTQGFGFSNGLTNHVIQVPEQPMGPCTNLLLNERLSHEPASGKEHEEKILKMKLQLISHCVTSIDHIIALPTSSSIATITVPTSNYHILGKNVQISFLFIPPLPLMLLIRRFFSL